MNETDHLFLLFVNLFLILFHYLFQLFPPLLLLLLKNQTGINNWPTFPRGGLGEATDTYWREISRVGRIPSAESHTHGQRRAAGGREVRECVCVCDGINQRNWKNLD